mgnify:CR=1 FL=1
MSDQAPDTPQDDTQPQEDETTQPQLPDSPDLTPVGDVVVTASVEIGRRQITIQEAQSITTGTIIQLDREIDTPMDLLINGQVVARGEVVVVDNEFGLRIVEIVDV